MADAVRGACVCPGISCIRRWMGGNPTLRLRSSTGTKSDSNGCACSRGTVGTWVHHLGVWATKAVSTAGGQDVANTATHHHDIEQAVLVVGEEQAK